eukprot:751076-Hanusia_phi.AAC.2
MAGANGEKDDGGGKGEETGWKAEEWKKELLKEKSGEQGGKGKNAQLEVETTVHNLQATLDHLKGRWEIQPEDIVWGK